MAAEERMMRPFLPFGNTLASNVVRPMLEHVLLVAGFSDLTNSSAMRCIHEGFGDIDRAGQKSNCFGGRNDKKPAMAMDSNEIEFRAVPAICLAPSERWKPG